MIRIAVCDDEKVIVSQIDKMLLEISKRENIPVEIDVFFSGEKLEKEILKGAQYDLLYLDIQMENNDGITVAKNIRKTDENVLIVFISGYDKYLMKLFQVDVFDFIKKPIPTKTFIKLFLKANDKICSKNIYFFYHYKHEEYKVLCSDIIYFESVGRKIKVHLKTGEIDVFNGKLNEVQINLANGKIPFLRIHQSFLVNYHFIKSRSKADVTLTTKEKLPISEERQKRFGQEYGILLGGGISE